MNRTKWIFALLTVLMIGSAAGVLVRFKAIQRLGEPGVMTRPIPGSKNLEVILPEKVLGFTSESVPQAEIVTNTLPKDTSFGQRLYRTPITTNQDFVVQANVVLMGSDRASLHKPDFCLEGAGWRIDREATARTTIPIAKPHPYDLPVNKMLVTREVEEGGKKYTYRGVYVYWYVTDGLLSGDPLGFGRMWPMAKTLLTTGVLQRWAYVTYFAYGPAGAEEEIYNRMKKLIAASVPEFQLTPKPEDPGPVIIP